MGAAFQTGIQGCAVAPEYVSAAQLDKVPLTLGNQYGHQTFDADPLAQQDNVGNAWMLEYAGGNAGIHIYISTYVAPRAWRWLGERWADPAAGIRAGLNPG
jgi:hypothetical protein